MSAPAETACGRAWELRRKLSELVAEFKAFSAQINTARLPETMWDEQTEAQGFANAAACDLAAVYLRLCREGPYAPLFAGAAYEPRLYDLPIGPESPS